MIDIEVRQAGHGRLHFSAGLVDTSLTEAFSSLVGRKPHYVLEIPCQC